MIIEVIAAGTRLGVKKMAENTRSIREIYTELFKGNSSALAKYSRVRHTLSEIEMWWNDGVSLQAISPEAKVHFSKTFLRGVLISEASRFEIEAGFQSLTYAERSCRKRCTRLVEELKDAYDALGISTNFSTSRFLDLMTFDYVFPSDCDGNNVVDPETGLPSRVFKDDSNRKMFYEELKGLLRKKLILSPVNIYRLAVIRSRAVRLPDED